MIKFLVDCICAFFLGQLIGLGLVLGACFGLVAAVSAVF